MPVKPAGRGTLMRYMVKFTQNNESLEVGTFSDLETAVKYGNDNSGNGVEFEVKIVK